MKAIPRLIAGTAVVLAAVLTAAPVTAGIADFVLNPGQQPTKRAAPQALTGARTAPIDTAVRTGTKERTRSGEEDDPSVKTADADAGTDSGTDSLAVPGFGAIDLGDGTDLAVSALGSTAGLVAHTVADADSRVSELARDLQAGVEAGEFAQADADRVLGDLSGYIRGERTWPERTVA